MEKIIVGDKVARNDTLALYSEEIFPSTMNFNEIYDVLAIHNRSTSDGLTPIKFITAELNIGEINICLLNKVTSS